MKKIPAELHEKILSFTDFDTVMVLRNYSLAFSMEPNKLWKKAVEDDSICKWLISSRKTCKDNDMLCLAMRNDNLELVDYLYYKLKEDNDNIFSDPLCWDDLLFDIAEYDCSVEIFKYLFSKECLDNICLETVLDYTVDNGRFDILDYIFEIIDKDIIKHSLSPAFNKAMKWENFEMIEFLIEHIEIDFNVSINILSETNYLHIIKFLHEKHIATCSTKAMNYAAGHGHLDIVKFLHENRTEGCTKKAMDLAATYGHLEVVKWLHENRTEGCSTYAMENAAYNGHLDIVKFLHENRTEGCSASAMDYAANNGHSEIVNWLFNQLKK